MSVKRRMIRWVVLIAVSAGVVLGLLGYQWLSTEVTVSRFLNNPRRPLSDSESDVLYEYLRGHWLRRFPRRRLSVARERRIIKAAIEQVRVLDDHRVFRWIVKLWYTAGWYQEMPTYVRRAVRDEMPNSWRLVVSMGAVRAVDRHLDVERILRTSTDDKLMVAYFVSCQLSDILRHREALLAMLAREGVGPRVKSGFMEMLSEMVELARKEGDTEMARRGARLLTEAEELLRSHGSRDPDLEGKHTGK
jgi:hypothetical protein